jgi:hypothetical protein
VSVFSFYENAPTIEIGPFVVRATTEPWHVHLRADDVVVNRVAFDISAAFLLYPDGSIDWPARTDSAFHLNSEREFRLYPQEHLRISRSDRKWGVDTSRSAYDKIRDMVWDAAQEIPVDFFAQCEKHRLLWVDSEIHAEIDKLQTQIDQASLHRRRVHAAYNRVEEALPCS